MNELINFIFSLSKVTTVSEKDLIFAYNYFLELEEYEKCSILNEFIKIKEFDSEEESYIDEYTWINEQRNICNRQLKDLNELKNSEDFEDKKNLILKIEKILNDLQKYEKDFWDNIHSIQEDIKEMIKIKNELKEIDNLIILKQKEIDEIEKSEK
jgi:hypothetical protein